MLFNGIGMVWDTEKQEVLCKFNSRGIFETDDKRIIAKLQQLGYSGEESTELLKVIEKTGTPVNWEDKYKAEHANLLAVTNKYLELKKRYEAFAEAVEIPAEVETVGEALEKGKEELEDFYLLGSYKISKEIKNEKISTLRNILKEYDALQGIPYMKVTKVKAVELTYQLLDREGLLR